VLRGTTSRIFQQTELFTTSESKGTLKGGFPQFHYFGVYTDTLLCLLYLCRAQIKLKQIINSLSLQNQV